MTWTIHEGNCLDVLPTLTADSVDSIVTDPPYNLTSGSGQNGFMGMAWDSGVAFRPETWKAVARVMRPSAYLVAFGGTRTWHRLVCAIEDAGLTVVDTLMWVTGQGFPKGKAQLKPSWEPIVLARKAGKYVAPLNIDASRIASNDFDPRERLGTLRIMADRPWNEQQAKDGCPVITEGHALGRWPSNLLLSHSEKCRAVGTRRVKGSNGVRGASNQIYGGGNGFTAYTGEQVGYADADGYETVTAYKCDESCPVALLDAQSGDRDGGGPSHRPSGHYARNWQGDGVFEESKIGRNGRITAYPDSGGASRFFQCFPPAPIDDGEHTRFLYCPKASKGERNRGLEDLSPQPCGLMEDDAYSWEGEIARGRKPRAATGRNVHPTVKPLALCEWLAKLICPPGGTILDPFAGSGSTLVAAINLGFDVVGIEREPTYAEIARRRCVHVEAAADRQPALLPALVNQR